MAWTTVQLSGGGLGNQLFEYAAGLAVAERTGTRLRLDACRYGVEPVRKFELDRYRIRAKVVHEPAESALYRNHDALEDAWVRGRYGAEPVREPHYHYDDILDHAKPDSFLIGFWQSPRHFTRVTKQLRRQLRPKRLGRTARALRRTISQSEQSVAVHVRRGDVASDAVIRRLIGSQPIEYYERAAALIMERHADPHFFVFSDDPAWCHENLDLPGPTQIVSGGTDAVEDLALIAACDDAIIANSTYSWWGAWLGETPGSIVVTPEKWFDELPVDSADVRPEHWIAL